MHEQVEAYRTLMVGEHAAVSVTVHAIGNCPAQQGVLNASYVDGGEPPLCNSSASGEVGAAYATCCALHCPRLVCGIQTLAPSMIVTGCFHKAAAQ